MIAPSVEEWKRATGQAPAATAPPPRVRDILYLASPAALSLKELCAQTAQQHGVTVDEIRSSRTTRKVVHARRQFVVAVFDSKPNVTISAIATFLNQHHTSVLYTLRQAGRT